jgi:hypothetical protein
VFNPTNGASPLCQSAPSGRDDCTAVVERYTLPAAFVRQMLGLVFNPVTLLAPKPRTSLASMALAFSPSMIVLLVPSTISANVQADM